MTAIHDPAVQRRRLRSELRRKREALGYTQRDVAKAMDWSLSKLIRIEAGSVGISISDLRVLLQHYGIEDRNEVDRFIEMARASKKQRAWWSDYREAISQPYLSFLSYESSASTILQFSPMLIPGLLQEEEYAEAILREISTIRPDLRVENLVRLRMRRQEEVFERPDPPKMLFILDEAVLHRWVGGRDVMRHQLERLKEEASRDNVTIEIVPFKAGAHPGMPEPFVILEFADDRDEDILFLENSRGDMSRDDREEIELYHEALARLQDLTADKNSNALIDDALSHLSAAE